MTDEHMIGPNRFLGLVGVWKSAANLGVVGVLSMLAVYVTIWTLPGVQKQFHESLKAEREAAREEIATERAASRAEAAASRAHGQQATKDISDAVTGLRDTIIEVQSRTHANQERAIGLQTKALKASGVLKDDEDK